MTEEQVDELRTQLAAEISLLAEAEEYVALHLEELKTLAIRPGLEVTAQELRMLKSVAIYFSVRERVATQRQLLKQAESGHNGAV